MKQLT